DPRLAKLIAVVLERKGPQRIAATPFTPFEALLRAIVFQSVSAKAADAIYKRVRGLVRGKLSPAKILAVPQETLKAAGLSRAKARFVHNLAEWFVANAKLAKVLATLSDDEVMEALTAIPGIGAWTVNIFMIFNLGRLDIVPVNDLVVRRGV